MEYLLHRALSTSAARSPDRVAVEDRDRKITYSELEARANRLGHLLVELGVQRGDRVALYLDKSLDSVVGVYGIMKAGACYVPFAPAAPARRLGSIAADAGISVIVTGAEKAFDWKALVEHGAPLTSLVVLDASEVDESAVPDGATAYSSIDVELRPSQEPDTDVIPLDLAYILYTSGSTGKPKGVMLSHLNCLTFVDWGVEEIGVTEEDRLSSHAPLHFDLSTWDLYAAARAGATVVLVPPETSVFPLEVSNFITENEISIWYSVPSILSLLTQRGNLKGGEFPTLRVLFFAGEVFPTKYLRRLMQFLPHVRFYNLYGPTETNVCTYLEVPPIPEDQDEPISIGAAIKDVECFAVTDEGTRARPGETGELWVRGTTVMHGYWNNPEKTAASLMRSPLGGELSDLAYRTGDLVTVADDGTFTLVGRRDHQIKSRGYRIELGEIETALYAHPAMVECAVIPVPDDTVTNKLYAYVVTKGDL
ncbi:MAG: amino acid adenylation domain-containing protein, partial [Actinomycetota bacterium]